MLFHEKGYRGCVSVVSREGLLGLCGRCFTRWIFEIVSALFHEKGFSDCVDVVSREGLLRLCGRCFTRRVFETL